MPKCEMREQQQEPKKKRKRRQSREMKNLAQRQRNRLMIANESEEQSAVRRQKQAEIIARVRASIRAKETADEIAARRKKQSDRIASIRASIRANENTEQAAARKQKEAERVATIRASMRVHETQKQIVARRQAAQKNQNARRIALARTNATAEQTAVRKKQQAERIALIRANETAEQRAARRQKEAERVALVRAMIQANETPEETDAQNTARRVVRKQKQSEKIAPALSYKTTEPTSVQRQKDLLRFGQTRMQNKLLIEELLEDKKMLEELHRSDKTRLQKLANETTDQIAAVKQLPTIRTTSTGHLIKITSNFVVESDKKLNGLFKQKNTVPNKSDVKSKSQETIKIEMEKYVVFNQPKTTKNARSAEHLLNLKKESDDQIDVSLQPENNTEIDKIKVKLEPEETSDLEMEKNVVCSEPKTKKNEDFLFIKYACPACNEEYNTHLFWKRHIKMRHKFFDEVNLNFKENPDGSSQCSECGYKCIKSSITLKQAHILKHMPYKKIYICLFCSFRTAYKECLILHVEKLHIMSVQYECHICDQNFESLLVYFEHCKTTHNEEETILGNFIAKNTLEKAMKTINYKPDVLKFIKEYIGQHGEDLTMVCVKEEPIVSEYF